MGGLQRAQRRKKRSCVFHGPQFRGARDFCVAHSLCGNVLHIKPKKSDQAMHVNMIEPSIGDTGRGDRTTRVLLIGKKDGYAPKRG